MNLHPNDVGFINADFNIAAYGLCFFRPFHMNLISIIIQLITVDPRIVFTDGVFDNFPG
jgi:hypothetical protein